MKITRARRKSRLQRLQRKLSGSCSIVTPDEYSILIAPVLLIPDLTTDPNRHHRGNRPFKPRKHQRHLSQAPRFLRHRVESRDRGYTGVFPRSRDRSSP